MRSIEIEVFGLPEVDERLAAVMERAEHPRPVFAQLADGFADRERVLFANDGEGHWDPLSKPYAAWKAHHHPGKPINVLTGTLRDSLTMPGAKYSVREISDAQMVVGTRDPVAHLAQHFHRNPIPLSKQEEAVWVEQIRRWLIAGEL
ncbi:MAG: hypothetical protein JWP11_32 [Frankiales bacterium]|nr:hypothetical protein [Frankiales bacterium]